MNSVVAATERLSVASARRVADAPSAKKPPARRPGLTDDEVEELRQGTLTLDLLSVWPLMLQFFSRNESSLRPF